MWLIVGLGNPGKKYANNRHNIGFMAADALRVKLGLPDYRDKFSGEFSRGDDVAILKPQTFMNVSGESVQPCAAFLKVAPSDVLVIHDELDVPFDEVRLKVGGGHGGHNGLRSIIERFGAEFARLRMGIGRPPADFRGDVADFVLADFSSLEKALLSDLVTRGVTATERVLKDGTLRALDFVNRKPKKAAPASTEGPLPSQRAPKAPGSPGDGGAQGTKLGRQHRFPMLENAPLFKKGTSLPALPRGANTRRISAGRDLEDTCQKSSKPKNTKRSTSFAETWMPIRPSAFKHASPKS